MMVRQLENKNQFEITMKGEIYFQSYSSTCAKIDKNGVLTFGKDWDYSKTTLKHLYIFLNDNKNSIENFTYSKIFHNGFNYSGNKRKFLQNLIDEKIIKVKEL